MANDERASGQSSFFLLELRMNVSREILSPQIDAIVAEAIAGRIFPGAVVLVARGDMVLHHAGYGASVYELDRARLVAPDTLYDIASLTKMFTATAALRLLDAGLINLDAPAARYLPELRTEAVLLRHLLTHTSGLDIRLSALRDAGREQLWQTVYGLAPAHAPGSRVAYTNVNSLLLGEIVARVSGLPLERALAELVSEPLGLRDTQFCPPAELLARIAPTERDEEWRGGLVHGHVHDESAYMLGGVAGHAGLFSSAADLYRFCRSWLTMPGERAPALLRPATLRLACENHTPGLSLACGLGWMIDRPAFMGVAPAGTLGHTGFTGPTMVLAPSQDLIVIVLSNRVYPRRSPPAQHAATAAIVGAALSYAAS